MSTLHTLKCWPEPFQDLVDELKHWTVRKNDRGFQVGDTLLLQEWDPLAQDYTGREVRRLVACMTRDVVGLHSGHVVLGLLPPQDRLVEALGLLETLISKHGRTYTGSWKEGWKAIGERARALGVEV